MLQMSLVIGKFGYFTLAINGEYACYDSDFYMYGIMGSWIIFNISTAPIISFLFWPFIIVIGLIIGLNHYLKYTILVLFYT
jgi:hypothetical protein